ncbi:transposable element Tcb1 transposase [Trichonephila clavipes]|nr:transposable element Tcb1 transposase [Trichonephila clavipes]
MCRPNIPTHQWNNTTVRRAGSDRLHGPMRGDWGSKRDPPREIGGRVGRNQTSVMRICDRWVQEGTTDRRGRSHPPQCTTLREDRRIAHMAVTDTDVSVGEEK